MNPVDGQARRTLAHRYEVAGLLGRGGMASVHLGRDVRLGRQVAIKMLRADLARDPSFHARFRREAMSAAALNHPSIVAVYDTGEDVTMGPGGVEEHTPFIVMEYVQGRTLRQILHSQESTTAHFAGGPDVPTQVSAPPSPVDTGGQTAVRGLEIGEAVKMTAGVLSALEYSHQAGIVHRDIKPANVMVTPAGDIKVMDFGIARAVADSSATMTQTQAVIGTAQYLSPEQARGETVDARSDLYSAGCLLYELLTGRPPFVGDSPVSVAYQHVREIPRPPSALNPQVPEALDRVVLKALAKDREDRYPDAAAFRADLLAAAAGRHVSAPSVAAFSAGTAATQALGVDAVTSAYPASRGTLFTPAAASTDVTAHDVDDEPRRRKGAAVALVVTVLALVGLAAFLLSQMLDDTSQEAPPVAVPQVVGMERAEAKSALEDAGLTYVEGTPENAEEPPGTVVDQNPPARSSVPPDTEVTVTLSLGPASVTVPALIGQTEQAARTSLEQAGLTVGEVTRQDHPEAPRDTVMSADPAPGTSVAKDTEVNLVISTGEVKVPDLVGMTTADARRALLELGLEMELSYEPSDQPKDTVLEQDPEPGPVRQGSRVSVVAAEEPPAPTTTPPPATTAPPETTAPPTTEPAPTVPLPTTP